MKSEWKVMTLNLIGGEKKYGVYRLRDASKVDHSGNRECHGEFVEDEEQAKRIAEELNIKERQGLGQVSTKQLVEELEKREGIEFMWIEPYVNAKVSVNGPALVLIVKD